MNKRILKTVYTVFFILLLAVPGAVFFVRGQVATGSEQKTELKDINYLNFTQKFDSYFSENFGLRGTLVEWNNRLKYALLRQSGEDSVIAGRDGWLFYEGALHDFTGKNLLSDDEIQEIADNIKAAQDYANSEGAEFVFVVAPNKMEIYGENMPYYCVESGEDGNYEHLMAALEERGVNYTDLKAELRSAAKASALPIYHKLDSHWNNMGASIAYASIMEKISFEAWDYSAAEYTVQDIFDGDLYRMLFPRGTKKDAQVVFDRENGFYYTSNFRGSDDLIITTANDGGRGSVLMFRDSFGSALYPFAANDFERAEVSRVLPYDLTDAGSYDLIIMEIVERNIANLLEYPPVLEAAD